jgi:organic hydroperoxide reductase OsmC/OhrA
VNGGELLTAALETCYCNDIYREAAKKKIDIESVEVEAECETARAVSYRARVKARASEDDIRASSCTPIKSPRSKTASERRLPCCLIV